MSPKFSVIIPAYNQAQFLPETIQSVLAQTLQDFEILVVNDASTDATSAVLAQYDDPRLKTILHPQNKGLPAARNTGMAAATGEYLALLDADDIFHPRKLEEHACFLFAHPNIQVTYNSRFELHHSSRLVREIYRPPLEVGLRDFIMGFPFSPSDIVIRREASERVNHFDAFYICGGEDMDYPCRLALAGNRFASVDKVLNYRRYHAGRPRKKLRCRIGDYTTALEKAMVDPRFPDELRSLIQPGLAAHYSEVSWTALAQGETELGVEILRELAHLDPTMIEGSPSRLATLFFGRSLKDYTRDHAELLRQVFSIFPDEMAVSGDLVEGFISRGYLIKGALSLLWEQEEAGKKYFSQARQRQAAFDETYLGWLASHVMNYQDEFGAGPAHAALARLSPYITQAGGRASMRSLRSLVSLNSAFRSFRNQQYSSTLQEGGRAISNNPTLLLNRGVLSIMLRSLIHPMSNEKR